MKTLICALSLALYLAAPVAALAQPEPVQTEETTGSAILSTLAPEHPRLIALDSDIERVKQLLATHPKGSQWREVLKQMAENAVQNESVKYELSGPRLLHQSRAALNRISLLGFVHRIEPDQRYVDRAVLEMETACAFPDWNPSHFLDTAEMTAAMAIGYDWFYAELSEETRKTVREAIISHGLNPGLERYNDKVWWVSGRNNWNHVCNGGMMVGALAIADEEPEIASKIMSRAIPSLAKGMALFAPDGGWLEASSYWVYTMKYTAFALSAMQSALGTTHGLDKAPGFEKTGYFMLAMEGPTGKHFNWGDGGEKFGSLPELYFLARHFHQPVIAWLAEKHTGGNPQMFDLIWHFSETEHPKENTQIDWYFGGIEVGSMRSSWDDANATFIAYKGGDNMAPHSNNDLGTFVFDTAGERWAIELGGDDYNLPGYWNRTQRLAYYRIRTEGQNTLILNGKEQNIRGKSKITRRGSSDTTAFAIADLTDGYQHSAETVTRGFMLTGAGEADARRHLVIQDEFESSATLEIHWLMHTQADVQIDGQTATMTIGDSTATLKIIEPAEAKLTVGSAEQQPPQQPNKGINRIDITHSQQAGSGRVVVQISPGSADAFAYNPEPLSDWE